MTRMITLADYFDEWVDIYKLGAVRDVTLNKYHMSSQWVHRLAPNLCVSRRLGHSSVDITQKIYLHIIRELENADTDKIMKKLSSILV